MTLGLTSSTLIVLSTGSLFFVQDGFERFFVSSPSCDPLLATIPNLRELVINLLACLIFLKLIFWGSCQGDN